MATSFKEMFHMGVVTARDPSLLKDGECAMAEDCIYRPNDPAIWKAPGRTAYGTVQATAVAGVVHSGSTLTGAFGTAVSSTTALGSQVITSAAGFTAGMVGQRVYGTGIQPYTYVLSFQTTSQVTLSKTASATGTVTLNFSDYSAGQSLVGSLITADTTISSVDSATQVTASQAVTAGTASVTVSSPVKATLFLAFDKARPNALLAYANSRLYQSTYTAATGTFATLLTGLSDTGNEHMDAVRDHEAYLVFSPGNRPRRVYHKDVSGVDTLTSRYMGMQPVSKCLVDRIAGTWSSVLGAGTYYFLVTEVFNADQPDEAEGTYDGDPVPITISDVATQGIRVFRNADQSSTKINSGLNDTNAATHWRVYMSPKQTLTLPVPSLDQFRLINTFDIAQASADLLDSNPTTAFVSAGAQDSTGYTTLYLNPAGMISANAATSTATTSGTSGNYTITTASSVAAVKVGMPVYGTNVAAGAVVTLIATGSPNTITLSKPNVGTVSGTVNYGPGESVDSSFASTPDTAGVMGIRLSNFGFINSNQFSGKAVVGVSIRIKYQWHNTEGSDTAGEDRGFNVYMKVGGTATNTKSNIGHRTGEGSSPTFGGLRLGYVEAGGNGDTWGRAWNTGLTDFLNGTIFLHVERAASAQYQMHFIDGVELKVFFSGVTVNLDGDAFRTITWTTQIGDTVSVGADGPPPNFDTADVIDGQLVTNDLSADGVIWGSLPDEYESYPTYYKANVNGDRWDTVMKIRRVGATGVLFCKNTIKRLNYFPTETDSDGTRGRAWENIANDHGCASKRGVALFDMPGRGVLAMYVASNGPWLTDGITCWKANLDLDWEGTVNPAYLSNAVLTSYPRLYGLSLDYTPTNGTLNTKTMWFSYDSIRLKDGWRLSAVGPSQRRAKSACRTDLSGTTQLLTGNLTDGKVYLEDSGYLSADANVTITPRIRGRLIYPNDVGGDARIERGWLRVGAAGDATTGVCHFKMRRQNIGENVTDAETAKDITTDATTVTDGRLIHIDSDNSGEALQVEITKDNLNAPMRIHYASLLGTGYGLEKQRA